MIVFIKNSSIMGLCQNCINVIVIFVGNIMKRKMLSIHAPVNVLISYPLSNLIQVNIQKDGQVAFGLENIPNVLTVKLQIINMLAKDFVSNVINKQIGTNKLLKSIDHLLNGKLLKRFMIYGLDLRLLDIMGKVKLNVIVAEKKIIDFYRSIILMEEGGTISVL